MNSRDNNACQVRPLPLEDQIQNEINKVQIMLSSTVQKVHQEPIIITDISQKKTFDIDLQQGIIKKLLRSSGHNFLFF